MVKACKEIISEKQNELSNDGLFSWMEVECLGACVNAPLVQINDDFYEDLNYENTKNVLQSFIDGNPSPIGSQTGRKGSRAEEYVPRAKPPPHQPDPQTPPFHQSSCTSEPTHSLHQGGTAGTKN